MASASRRVVTASQPADSASVRALAMMRDRLSAWSRARRWAVVSVMRSILALLERSLLVSLAVLGLLRLIGEDHGILAGLVVSGCRWRHGRRRIRGRSVRQSDLRSPPGRRWPARTQRR